MAQITLKGNPINTVGNLPETGNTAPDFVLTTNDLIDVRLEDYDGKRMILNVFPSLDTDVCAASVRRFNSEAGKLPNTRVLCISMDLPFAQKRFCGADGLENVITLSCFRHSSFGDNYGVRIVDGPLAGLMSRAVIVTGEDGRVLFSEQVPEITQEPDYDSALAVLD